MQYSATHTRLAKRSGDFRGEHDDFGVAHCALAKGGHHIGCSRTCCSNSHAETAADSRQPICGIAGGLLVAHPDDGGDLATGLPKGQVMYPWQTENVGNPSGREAFEDGLGQGGGGERHSASVSHLRVGSSRDLPLSEPRQFFRNRRLLRARLGP